MTRKASSKHLGIHEVVKRSGLSSQTIHLWEKKYGVVDPRRTHANRFLYTEADVFRLALLAKATQSGHRIADVANMTTARLEKLVNGPQLARRRRPASSSVIR